MPETDESQEEIQLLASQGRITHIVVPAGDRAMSTRTLVQRCEAAGFDGPVALADGRVAINAPHGLPSTLEALQLSVLAITPGTASASAGRPSDADRLVAIDSALKELEARISGDLKFVRGRAADATKAAATQAPEEATSGDEDVPADLATEPDLAPETKAAPAEQAEAAAAPLVLRPSEMEGAAGSPVGGAEVATDLNESAVPEADQGLPQEPETAGSDSDGAGSVSAASDESLTDTAALPEAGDGVGDDPETVEDFPEDVEQLAEALSFLPSAEPSQAEAAAPPPDPTDHGDAVAAPDALPDRPSIADDAVVAGLEDLKSRVAQHSESIETLVARLDALLDRPAPRPDMTEANRYFARFATAFAKALTRLEAVSDRLEAVQSDQPGAEIVAGLTAIRSEMSDLTASVANGSTGPAGAEIAHLIALQEVLVRQMAAALEEQSQGQSLGLSEFLTDLRHTIAELIAEQKRATLAS